MAGRRKNYIIKIFNKNQIIKNLKNWYVSKEKVKELKAIIKKLHGSKRFIHISTEESSILENLKIECSSGGLGGVVYAVPLYNDKIHNLGKYIINDELPMFLKNNNQAKKLSMFLLEPENIKFGIIDYLNFGKKYYGIFKKFELNINQEEVARIEKDEYKKILKVYMAKLLEQEIFECINSSKLLKMTAFETLSECLFMRQKQSYNDEMDNRAVKQLIYETSPELSKQFFTSRFFFKSEVFEKVRESLSFDSANIEEYFLFLLKQKIKKYFISNRVNLIGHILYRYFDHKELFEQELAKMIWQESKCNKVSILTYMIPKGEIGILPVKLKNVKIMDVEGKMKVKSRKDITIVGQLSKKYIMRQPVHQ